MKRAAAIIALFLLLSTFSCCSPQDLDHSSNNREEASGEETPPDGQGPATVNGLNAQEVSTLVQQLTEKGNEAFWWYFGDGMYLDVEPSDDYTHIIRRVGRFGTILELQEATEAVFTKRFCQDILYPVGFNEEQGENIKFREVDGALHINLNNGGMGWNSELTDQISLLEESLGEIAVSIVCDELSPEGEGAVQVPYQFLLVLEDGTWKLDNWFQYGTDKNNGNLVQSPGEGGLPAEPYVYDPASGTLAFPALNFACTLPPQAMEQIELLVLDAAVPSDQTPGEETVLGQVTFLIKGDSLSYGMFLLSRWDAAEWDIPREYGPLPTEVARSADSRWVVVHSPAALAAETPATQEERDSLWEWVEAYEAAVVDSVRFL